MGEVVEVGAGGDATPKGRSLLNKAKSIKLTALGSFTPKSGKPTTKRKLITLKPH